MASILGPALSVLASKHIVVGSLTANGLVAGSFRTLMSLSVAIVIICALMLTVTQILIPHESFCQQRAYQENPRVEIGVFPTKDPCLFTT